MPDKPDDGLAGRGFSGQFLSRKRPRRAEDHAERHDHQHDHRQREVTQRSHDLNSQDSIFTSLSSELAITYVLYRVCKM